MSLRSEFTALAKGHGVSVAELARRFGISRKTAYKWLNRDAASEPLSDRSRRPHGSPTQTSQAREQAVSPGTLLQPIHEDHMIRII